MAENKTKATDASVRAFLDAVEPEKRRIEGRRLDELFRQASGFEPKMWGENIVGYGTFHYKYATGREGDWLATGFSPRKARLSLYIMPGYQDYSHILKDLGKHALGKSCLYINKLADVDEAVLVRLIRQGLKDLDRMNGVQPT